jgi:hypothetical protein
MAQKRMKVDAALPWCWFIPVEYIRRLHHQVYPVWPHPFETTQLEEGCVTVSASRLYGHVVDEAAHATCELTAARLQRAPEKEICVLKALRACESVPVCAFALLCAHE